MTEPLDPAEVADHLQEFLDSWTGSKMSAKGGAGTITREELELAHEALEVAPLYSETMAQLNELADSVTLVIQQLENDPQVERSYANALRQALGESPYDPGLISAVRDALNADGETFYGDDEITSVLEAIDAWYDQQAPQILVSRPGEEPVYVPGEPVGPLPPIVPMSSGAPGGMLSLGQVKSGRGE